MLSADVALSPYVWTFSRSVGFKGAGQRTWPPSLNAADNDCGLISLSMSQQLSVTFCIPHMHSKRCDLMCPCPSPPQHTHTHTTYK